jgi:hypothetical protein
MEFFSPHVAVVTAPSSFVGDCVAGLLPVSYIFGFMSRGGIEPPTY